MCLSNQNKTKNEAFDNDTIFFDLFHAHIVPCGHHAEWWWRAWSSVFLWIQTKCDRVQFERACCWKVSRKRFASTLSPPWLFASTFSPPLPRYIVSAITMFINRHRSMNTAYAHTTTAKMVSIRALFHSKCLTAYLLHALLHAAC